MINDSYHACEDDVSVYDASSRTGIWVMANDEKCPWPNGSGHPSKLVD